MGLFGKLGKHRDDPKPGTGRKFKFHGAYTHKSDAVTKEKSVGGFIIERTVRGQRRYFVMTKK